MNTLINLLLLVQMLSAIGMIGLILIQHGKGADMGAAFGSGTSGSLFGATGGANFLSRTTAVLAAVFFISTLALAYFGNMRPASSGSLLERAATKPAGVVDNIPASGVGKPAATEGAPASVSTTPAAGTTPAGSPAHSPANTPSPASQIPAK